jgi:sugar phosphate isomerase/epimerase
MMSRLAISTALFDGQDMAVALEEIAAAGVQRVEPAFIGGYSAFAETSFSEGAARKLADLAVQSSLSIAAVSAHMDLGHIAPDAASMLERRIRFAAACNCRVLITNAGLAADMDRIVSRIEAALPLCEELGVRLALENPGHGTGAAIYDMASGQRFVRRFGHPLVQLNYDAGNVYTYSGGRLQPSSDVGSSGVEEIGYLHLKDIAGGGDDWAFCALGRGEVHYAEFLPLVPHDLPVSIELPLHLTRPGRRDPVRREVPIPLATLRSALRHSLHTLRTLAFPF